MKYIYNQSFIALHSSKTSVFLFITASLHCARWHALVALTTKKLSQTQSNFKSTVTAYSGNPYFQKSVLFVLCMLVVGLRLSVSTYCFSLGTVVWERMNEWMSWRSEVADDDADSSSSRSCSSDLSHSHCDNSHRRFVERQQVGRCR